MADIFERALSLHRQGKLPEAARLYQKALQAEPTRFDALHGFGILCSQQGRHGEAVELFRRALRQRPESAEAQYNLGIAFEALGQLQEAAAHYNAALALRPDVFAAHNNLGNVLQALGRHEDAVVHYRRALALKPDLALAHNNLGNALFALRRREEALDHYRRAIALQPDYIEAHNNLGNLLGRLGHQDDALACYQRALALEPRYVDAHYNLGNALKELGRLDEAMAAYEKAIAIDPKRVGPYYELTHARKVKPADRVLPAMEALAVDIGSLPEEEQTALHFALAKAYDDLGRSDQAFRQWVFGNALKRRHLPYNEATIFGMFARIEAAFPPELIREKAGGGEESAAPVFIIGMPRSGTTLVEQILASHPKVFGAGELEDLPELVLDLSGRDKGIAYPEMVQNMTGEELRAFGASYLDRLRSLSGTGSRITDKMPSNFLYLGLIHLALPNARIIHVQRDPVDTCMSCFSKLFIGTTQAFSYDLGELGLYWRHYEALMKHWRRVLPQGAMFEIHYEDLVADLDTWARRLVAHCGLEWDDACLAFHKTRRPVSTASATQVRQPLYTSAVGRWRAYEQHLAPLLEALRPDGASQVSFFLEQNSRIRSPHEAQRNVGTVSQHAPHPDFASLHSGDNFAPGSGSAPLPFPLAAGEGAGQPPAVPALRRESGGSPKGASKPRIGKLLRRATAHHDAGRLEQAHSLYRQVLALDPNHAECHYRLGLVANRLGRGESAVGSLARATELAPEAAAYHLDLGLVLTGLGRPLEAVSSCLRALRLEPNYAQAHHAVANALSDLARHEEALGHYQEALRIKPDWPAARYNLANTLSRLGWRQEAEQQYRETLRLKPDFAQAYNNLAQLLNREGGFEEAASLCCEALRLQPNYAEAHHNLGDALSGLSRFEEAERCYRQALRLRPNLATLHRNLGDVLADLNRCEEAMECYWQALRLKPDMPDVFNSLGLTFCALGREDEAEPCFAEAVRLMPGFTAARVNHCMARLRIVYRDEAEIERARNAYAAELKAVCSGDALPAPLTLEATGGKSPFLLAYQGRCDRDLQAIYGGFIVRVMSALYPRWASPPEVEPPQPGEAIRVGILSMHFDTHSNWKIPIKGWLLGLDKQRFQMFGYHLGHREDSETAVAKSLCHRFVQGLPTFSAWVEAIRADRLHVLLIPGIGMDTATIRLAALRLAPVQATSWGHPETSGLPTIDDYLSSELMEPPGAEAHYTERLVRLPNLSIRYEPLAVAPDAVARPELGLTDEAVLYWCCQSLFKYLPQYDWVFARIAAAVPKAQFLFIQYAQGDAVMGTFRGRLAAAFAEAGLDAEQHCRFVPPMSMARFAGVSRIADVFLDSLGWSGCNSTLEALAWDLPVVTMAGDLMRGRHSAAILTMLGMPELIAATPDAFVALAVELARDPARRRALSARIARDKHRLYADQACIDGLAHYLCEAAHRPRAGTPAKQALTIDV